MTLPGAISEALINNRGKITNYVNCKGLDFHEKPL